MTGGGGAGGGKGAVVSLTIPVVPGQRVLTVVGRPVSPLTGALDAGAGGDAAWIKLCDPEPASCDPAAPMAVAAGGGGSGAGTALLPGGAGGDAGVPGGAGTAGDQPGAQGAGGGGGTITAGGRGGAAGTIPSGCLDGRPGSNGRDGGPTADGEGGLSAVGFVPAGGGGGAGLFGGGGGGSAARCVDETAQSAGAGNGGGGGGASLVPPGGRLELAMTRTVPSIRYKRVLETIPPTIAISAPTEDATYTQGEVVRAEFSCTASGTARVALCGGTVANGRSIDTASVGTKTFAVTARDTVRNTTTQRVSYTVVASSPRPARLSIRNVGVTRSTVRFTLSASAQVTLRIERRVPRRGRSRGRPVRGPYRSVRTLRHDGVAGVNRVAFGRRALAPGTYRVSVTADASGRTTSAASRTFTVRRAGARARRRGGGRR